MRRTLRALSSGRRAVRLGRWPLLQLKLPLVLLGSTAAFGALFAAHTFVAWRELVTFGAQDAWVAQLGSEILRDYLRVSTAIAGAYVVFLVFVCLAYTHRLLGPIVALERHLELLRLGRHDARIRLRAGHPLSAVADELNSLGGYLRDRPRDSPRRQESPGHSEDLKAADTLASAIETRAA